MATFSAASILLVVLPALLKPLVESRAVGFGLGDPQTWAWPVSALPILLGLSILAYLTVGGLCLSSFRSNKMYFVVSPGILLEHYRDIDTDKGRECYLTHIDQAYRRNSKLLDAKFNKLDTALWALGSETVCLALAILVGVAA